MRLGPLSAIKERERGGGEGGKWRASDEDPLGALRAKIMEIGLK